MLVCSVASCAKSAPVSSPADITVCKQWAAFEDGGSLSAFESEWESDVPPASSQLENDVNTYLTLMQAGGFEPGSGEQTQTAQAGVNVSNDCQAIGISSGG
jgi:hypothetical protein